MAEAAGGAVEAARFAGAVGELAGRHRAAVRELGELRAALEGARAGRAAADAAAGARQRADAEAARALQEEGARLSAALGRERARAEALAQDLAQSKGDYATLLGRQETELEREKAWRLNLEGETPLPLPPPGLDVPFRTRDPPLGGSRGLSLACSGGRWGASFGD